MTESHPEIESALNIRQQHLSSKHRHELDYRYNKIQQDVEEVFNQNDFPTEDLPLTIQAQLVGRKIENKTAVIRGLFSSCIFEDFSDTEYHRSLEYIGLKAMQTQWSGSPQVEFPAADEDELEKVLYLEQRINELSPGSLKELDPTHMLVLSIILARILYPGISDSAELIPLPAIVALNSAAASMFLTYVALGTYIEIYSTRLLRSVGALLL